MSLVAQGLPNNPPRWPEVNDIVGKILMAYKAGGKPWERLNEWIDRIGWKRFFEECDLEFQIDDSNIKVISLNCKKQVLEGVTTLKAGSRVVLATAARRAVVSHYPPISLPVVILLDYINALPARSAHYPYPETSNVFEPLPSNFITSSNILPPA